MFPALPLPFGRLDVERVLRCPFFPKKGGWPSLAPHAENRPNDRGVKIQRGGCESPQQDQSQLDYHCYLCAREWVRTNSRTHAVAHLRQYSSEHDRRSLL